MHPAQRQGSRIGNLAQTIDFAPTIYDSPASPPPPGLSGRSLKPLLEAPDRKMSGEAYAEVKMLSFQGRSLLSAGADGLWQAIHAEAVAESDGFWASKEVHFDAVPPAVEFRAVAFHQPRPLDAFVDGEKVVRFDLGTDWGTFRLELPGRERKHLVSLKTDGCDTPLSLGLGQDGRCLSFKLHGLPLERRELFELMTDPAARHDLSTREIPRLRTMLDQLATAYRHTPRAAPVDGSLSEEQIRQLKALGYLQ